MRGKLREEYPLGCQSRPRPPPLPRTQPHKSRTQNATSSVAKLQLERRRGEAAVAAEGVVGSAPPGLRDAIQWSVRLTSVQVKLNWKSSTAG